MKIDGVSLSSKRMDIGEIHRGSESETLRGIAKSLVGKIAACPRICRYAFRHSVPIFTGT